MSHLSLVSAPIDAVTAQAEEGAATPDQCVHDAHVDFCEDLAHHLNWADQQIPGRSTELAMSMALALLNAAAGQGAKFTVTKGEDGQFVFAASQ